MTVVLNGGMSARLLVSTTMPLNNADHAGEMRLVDATSCPRVALSFGAVVNRSNSSRSCTGALLAASKLL